MKNKSLVLLLVLALMLGLFTGCAGTASTEADAQTVVEAEPAAEPEKVEEAAASEAPAETSLNADESVQDTESAAPEAAPEEKTVPEDVPEMTALMTYPLEREVKVVLWAPFNENEYKGLVTSQLDLPGVQNAIAATGVDLELVETSQQSATEQFQLMIASGDWPDVANLDRYYTGGVSTAYNDDVILDLTDLLPDNMPDAWALVEALPGASKIQMLNDGLYLGIPSINFNGYSDEGLVTRGDWLEKMGYEAVPSTFAEFEAMLYDIHNNYQTEYTYKVGTSGAITGLEDVFGTTFFDLSGTDGALTLFLDNDTVVNASTCDSYRAYLEWFACLYQDGIIYHDFLTESLDRDTSMSYVGQGKVGVWSDRANNLEEYKTYSEDPDFEIVPMDYITDEDGLYNWAVDKSSNGAGCSLFADCEDPEGVLQFLNYFYTQDGQLLANYGTEGVTFNYDEDGNVVWTDYVLNNPDGLNTNQAVTYYGWALTQTRGDASRMVTANDEWVIGILSIWNDSTKLAYGTEIPDGASLDSDEQEQVTNNESDLYTYMCEALTKFVTGTEQLTDESWQAYLEQCEVYHLSDILAVYQQAYDDYLVEIAALD